MRIKVVFFLIIKVVTKMRDVKWQIPYRILNRENTFFLLLLTNCEVSDTDEHVQISFEKYKYHNSKE